jgi:hypothetical protein
MAIQNYNINKIIPVLCLTNTRGKADYILRSIGLQLSNERVMGGVCYLSHNTSMSE